MLSFTMLGQVFLSKDGLPANRFRSQKELALLVYLAQTGQSHQRSFLADLLWASHSEQQALTNLRTALTRLRKTFGDALAITRKSVALKSESCLQIDSVQLLQTLAGIGRIDSAATAVTLQEALDTYRGDFLAGLQLRNASNFDSWAMATRKHIRRQVTAAYEKLGAYALSTGDVEYGIAVARRWLQVDSLDEAANTLLIQLLLEAGQERAAAAHYKYAIELLQTELGIAPPAPMKALIDEALPKYTMAIRPPLAARHNLPAVYDQFFGRLAVQQGIESRLDQPWCRLVTIMGPGGVGKTRLAATIGRSRLGHYRDGVWLVELADVDPADNDLAEAIAVEIATTLDLRLSGSAKPGEQLLDHLRYKQVMLVLDNFEHLLAGTQIVQDIIRRCEHVQLLVTTREALRLRAEWTVVLNGLRYPASDADERPADAVDLFKARYAQQRPGPIAADEQAAIRAICRLVEGVPLAIELAAALTRHDTCRTVANRLREGFGDLTTPLRDVPLRHHGLHIVFEASWRTLTPALKQRLARLSVFHNGFTETAALQVAEADAQQLWALFEKSLLSFNEASRRYALHAVVREYAAEKRAVDDQSPQKHTLYYLTMLSQHSELLQKNTPQRSMRVIEPDIDNIRHAWQAGVATRSAAPLAAALRSLSIFYQLRGLAREAEAVMHATRRAARTWGDEGIMLATHAGLEQARFQIRLGRYRPAIQTLVAALNDAEQGADRWAEGMASVWWGEALWRLGEYDAAREKLNHALTIASAIQSTLIVGWSHHQLGIIGDIQGRYAEALNHLQHALAAWRTLDNAQALSGTLNSIGLVSFHQGDLPGAQQALEQALAICEQTGDHHRQSNIINNLSSISNEYGDYKSAQNYLQLGLQLATDSGNLTGQGDIHINLGNNYLLQGKLVLALESLERGLRITESIGNREATAVAMIILANTKSEQGEPEQAYTWYCQALDIARQNSLQRIECSALIGLAELLSQTEAHRARKYSEAAVALAEALQNPHQLKRAQAIDHYLYVATK